MSSKTSFSTQRVEKMLSLEASRLPCMVGVSGRTLPPGPFLPLQLQSLPGQGGPAGLWEAAAGQGTLCFHAGTQRARVAGWIHRIKRAFPFKLVLSQAACWPQMNGELWLSHQNTVQSKPLSLSCDVRPFTCGVRAGNAETGGRGRVPRVGRGEGEGEQ